MTTATITSTKKVRMPKNSSSSAKTPKYRNRKCTYDGRTFDSQKERDRYIVLRGWLKQGLIWDLVCQPVVPIEVNGVKVCDVVPDFSYAQWTEIGLRTEVVTVYEDVKSPITRKNPTYRLKKKLAAALGIEIVEV